MHETSPSWNISHTDMHNNIVMKSLQLLLILQSNSYFMDIWNTEL